MAKCTPYYTTADTDNDQCYHNNDACPSGQNIKPENKAFGTDGRPLCQTCASMN